MTNCRRSLGWWIAIAIVVFVCTGCSEKQAGPPTAHLQGTVTINGKPIPADAAGTIIFDPVVVGDARPASSPIKDGRYEVEQAPLGKVRAIIHITQELGPVPGGGDRQMVESKSLVPENLKDGQEIQVDGDNAHLDFDLK